MVENDEQFLLTPNIDEPMNPFKIVHLHNKTKTYHLTRQILLDSILTQNAHCFFYHILTKGSDEFNIIYGSFACLIMRKQNEADVYLNVNTLALKYIVKYIQTNKLYNVSLISDKKLDKITDLATVFGMPVLVTHLRNTNPKLKNIKNLFERMEIFFNLVVKIYENKTNYNFDKIKNFIKAFEKKVLKKSKHMNYDKILKNCLNIFIFLFMIIFLSKNENIQKLMMSMFPHLKIKDVEINSPSHDQLGTILDNIFEKIDQFDSFNFVFANLQELFEIYISNCEM